jgi:hypothetical protein
MTTGYKATRLASRCRRDRQGDAPLGGCVEVARHLLSTFPASPREKRPVNVQSGYLLNPLWFINSQMRPIQE